MGKTAPRDPGTPVNVPVNLGSTYMLRRDPRSTMPALAGKAVEILPAELFLTPEEGVPKPARVRIDIGTFGVPEGTHLFAEVDVDRFVDVWDQI